MYRNMGQRCNFINNCNTPIWGFFHPAHKKPPNGDNFSVHYMFFIEKCYFCVQF